MLIASMSRYCVRWNDGCTVSKHVLWEGWAVADADSMHGRMSTELAVWGVYAMLFRMRVSGCCIDCRRNFRCSMVKQGM